MNKRVINDEIDMAYKLLSDHKIANNGVIDKTFRGQISTFGAAITMGSLLAAIAYFSANGGASVERQNLLKVIYDIIKSRNAGKNMPAGLFEYANACRNRGVLAERVCKEEILNAAIATKLAMNLYELKE